ncbi:HAMP domain-containing histidine kinase [Thalassotalea litorea]|uniref:histidine kinase n=1 Tax=Thalassotalea litorea TaxID=2020715 RepID=A0A5R9IW16_9GAMM|nr:HAMP domain-containing sensor histidine kinase [Thalassotalea litorea]TLU67366.1 HAMP domain-containing histidine kinase [Thalassotalea litorea]
MHSHFFRFYLFILLAVFALMFSFGQLYSQFYAPPVQYNIPIETVFSAQQSDNPAKFRYVDKFNIQLSPDLLLQLQNNETIAYVVNEQMYYLRNHDSNRYIQWGPVDINIEPVDDNFLVLFFYSGLAIVFLLLMWPMFRDLSYLQKCAVKFGENQEPQPLTIAKNSTVYPLAHALYTMSSRLVEFVALQRDIAKIIAHEVRTPLARMKFVLKRVEGKIEDKHLQRMLMDVAELETLATDYMTFSRSQQLDPDYNQPIPLQSLLRSLEDKYRNLEIPVHFTGINEAIEIYANQPQLELALSNLLNNALRYARNRVDVSADCDEKYVNFYIDDDGPGFDGDKPRTNNQGTATGFGLGLYIVESIVNRHDGALSKSSAPLGGARAIVEIPRVVE